MLKRSLVVLVAAWLLGQNLACLSCPESDCAPDEAPTCSGSNVVRCVLREASACTYHAWLEQENCSAQGQSCEAGACITPVTCPSGAQSVCQGDRVFGCGLAGRGELRTDCSETGQVCREAQVDGQRTAACALDEKPCTDDGPTAYECRASQRVFCQYGHVMEIGECGEGRLCSMVGGVAMCSDGEPPVTEIDWKAVPGGSFHAGSEDERSQSGFVDVEDFDLQEREVTNAAYRECVSQGACSEPWLCQSLERDRFFEANLPVVCVDAEQAEAYCAFVGGRLPTGLEWEYAMRNGGQDVNYPWGNDDATCERAVIGGPPASDADCAWSQPSTGCSLEDDITEQGACDLVGNVGEWVRVAGTLTSYERKGEDFASVDVSRLYSTSQIAPDTLESRLGLRCAR